MWTETISFLRSGLEIAQPGVEPFVAGYACRTIRVHRQRQQRNRRDPRLQSSAEQHGVSGL